MKLRWLINLALLIGVLGLALLMREEITRARSIPELTDLVADDVYQVRIARQGEPTIVLNHDLLGWRMHEPMQLDADTEQVEKLLGILKTPVLRSVPEASAALDELELAPARLTLQVDTVELRFGGIDPLGQSRYVASDGLVHLISDRFYHLLIAPPIDYVSRKLLPRDFNPIFGRLGGVPLDAGSVTALNETVAERIEPLAEALNGSPAELKMGDGSRLSFVVSDDHRRWARLDQRLLYVLTDGPELALDPGAEDPTPPEPPVSPAATAEALAPAIEESSPTAPEIEPLPDEVPVDAYGAVPTEKVPYEPPMDPNGIVPGDGSVSTPPVVKLTPDGREIPISPGGPVRQPSTPRNAGGAPYGFGQDPFAPDPPAGTTDPGGAL
ncbi:DUF4340 domain-containing protein [Thiocystis violacea]|uniref:DUF4340 domain-containing protein n=1 Tax=Thiocystis violacea TaxID=13725 RepID=UPI0019077513|nr:DUF4340 domain-containing protein [Thiocystis violacea]MBK1722064.1 hypothetical protein [Thiocystis violacea]